MAKRNQRKDPLQRKQATHETMPLPASKARALELVLLILACAGLLVTGYLTYSKWFGVHPAFCEEGSGCDIVQASRWSTFLGLPMALWGFLTYLTMAWLIWQGRRRPKPLTWLVYVNLCGFAISAYLTVISIVKIQATCAYCLASFSIITAMLILTILRQPPQWLTAVKEGALVAVVLVIGLHLHYSGVFSPAAGPEDPQLAALAEHLTESGAKFYGASWCPRCQEQKDLFGASASRLPYIECSSGGRGSPLTPACAKMNIRSFPTWIINGKRYTGLKTPEELAALSGFRWQKPDREN
ncbi:MAG: Vitamin K epoxide reductase [Nitrospirae bacterium]|nr:MAG: Vitamin K epoxide reductase [Nitrospirota bacterium]